MVFVSINHLHILSNVSRAYVSVAVEESSACDTTALAATESCVRSLMVNIASAANPIKQAITAIL